MWRKRFSTFLGKMLSVAVPSLRATCFRFLRRAADALTMADRALPDPEPSLAPPD
jgi:hypothetical protein